MYKRQVLSLEKYGVTEKIAAVLGGKGELFKYGFASFLVSKMCIRDSC